jgi:hypothetical protein
MHVLLQRPGLIVGASGRIGVCTQTGRRRCWCCKACKSMNSASGHLHLMPMCQHPVVTSDQPGLNADDTRSMLAEHLHTFCSARRCVHGCTLALLRPPNVAAVHCMHGACATTIIVDPRCGCLNQRSQTCHS